MAQAACSAALGPVSLEGQTPDPQVLSATLPSVSHTRRSELVAGAMASQAQPRAPHSLAQPAPPSGKTVNAGIPTSRDDTPRLISTLHSELSEQGLAARPFEQRDTAEVRHLFRAGMEMQVFSLHTLVGIVEHVVHSHLVSLGSPFATTDPSPPLNTLASQCNPLKRPTHPTSASNETSV